MDDLMSKLQNVLNDKESMKQIQELAGMLTGEKTHQQESAQNSAVDGSSQQGNQSQNNSGFSQLLSALGGASGDPANTDNTQNNVPDVFPDSENVKAPDQSLLLSGLGGNSGKSDHPENGSGFDIAKLMQLQSIMTQANKSDKNVELLLALKPLLKEENQIKINRLVKIFKLFAIYPLLKESGLLGGDLFGLL